MTHIDNLYVEVVNLPVSTRIDVFASLDALWLNPVEGPEALTVWQWIGNLQQSYPYPRAQVRFRLTEKLAVLRKTQVVP